MGECSLCPTAFMRRLMLTGPNLYLVADDSIVVDYCTLVATTDNNGVVYYPDWYEIRWLLPASLLEDK